MSEAEKITLAKFQELSVELFKCKVEVDAIESKLKERQDVLEAKKAQLQAFMEENEMQKTHVKGHGLLYLETRFMVPTPKTTEEKKALGKYFTERGIFWEMMSVNSQTLNGYYKTEVEAAIARGDVDFKLPGVGKETHVTKLKLRKE